MDYLAREGAPCGDGLWEKIDSAVIDTARKNLIGRRFLSIFGPLGAGAQSIQNDKIYKTEETNNGIVKTTGRTFIEIPQLYQDFSLLWRDIENSRQTGYPLELSSVFSASQAIAHKEDNLIFFGDEFIGAEGIMNAEGAGKLPRSDWKTGENAFFDITKALALMGGKSIFGRYVLCVSPDLYCDLQRIQQGTGLMEIDRISKLVDGRVFNAPILGTKKAVLLCAESQYMDLVIGQDMAAAYLEQKDLNHYFRIIETIIPRIKNSEAIVIFE